jgi:hypothetical protein
MGEEKQKFFEFCDNDTSGLHTLSRKGTDRIADYWLSLLSHQREQVLDEAIEMFEKTHGKKGTMNGSFGYQGIVMGIEAYQMPDDKARDEIIEILEDLKNK